MSIIVNEEKKIFALTDEKTTFIMTVNEIDYLKQSYFGKSICVEDFINEEVSSEEFKLEYDIKGAWELNNTNLQSREVQTQSNYDYKEAMVKITRKNGVVMSEFLFESYEILKSLPKPEGMPFAKADETLKITLNDKKAKVKMILYYALVDGALLRHNELINYGDEEVFIDRAYSFSLHLCDHEYDAVTFCGSWGNERCFERTPLHHGVFQIDSKYGVSSPVLNPFMIVCDKDTTEDYGNAYGLLLVYSGSHAFKADVWLKGNTYVTGGINDYNFCWKLEPNEKFTTPQAILVPTDKGFGDISRTLHDVLRNNLINPKYVNEPRPVVINNWEGTTFYFDKQKLIDIIDKVIGTGIDTFVLDDGWFGARNNDRAGLGDWVVNTEKLPGGLKPIIDHCHKNGLKFGLWFEPEMVNPDSDLFRAHPDWAISVEGYKTRDSRYQYCLDITREDVRDYIVDAVNKVLKENEIDYVKWDHNRYVADDFMKMMPADRQKECHHRYCLGYYDLCERIVNANPDIFFEGCASGGGRFDAGSMYYFPQIWLSDMADAVERTRIQYGSSFAYPLSTMSCHVTKSPYDNMERVTSPHTRADIAHLGAFGYEYDTTKVPESELALISSQVKEYRDMQDLVLKGDLYRIESPFTYKRNFAEMIVSKDKKKAHLTAFSFEHRGFQPTRKIKIKGLNPDYRYKVLETGETFSGKTLLNKGIIIPDGHKKHEKGKRVDYTTDTYTFIKVD